jgi:hypothetical protein
MLIRSTVRDDRADLQIGERPGHAAEFRRMHAKYVLEVFAETGPRKDGEYRTAGQKRIPEYRSQKRGPVQVGGHGRSYNVKASRATTVKASKGCLASRAPKGTFTHKIMPARS